MEETRNSSNSLSSAYAEIDKNASNFDLISYHKNYSSSITTLQTRKRSTTKLLAVVSCLLSVVCILCVGAFSCWVFLFNDGARTLFPQTAKMVGGQVDTEVCVPCLQVSPDPLDNSESESEMWRGLDVRYDTENDTKICCASNAAQYAALFKLILQRQDGVQKLAEYLEATNGNNDSSEDSGHDSQPLVDQRSSVSAHLVFKPQPQRTLVPTDKYVQHWKSPRESSMSHMKGFKLHNHHKIIVQSPGLYYVYCQFLYNPPASSSTSRRSDVIPHQHVTSAYVRRYSILRPSASTFLLKSRHTRADLEEDRHSSYAGGVFRLHKGDSLYVQVSQPDLISYDDVASFFGLFKVGS